jgi:hypothetical protein
MPKGGISMANFSYLLQADANGDLTGFHVTFTNEGPVLIIFSNEERLGSFVDALYPVLAKEGKKIAYASMPADSIESVVQEILEQDPGMAEAIFVPDDAPIVDTILDFYTSAN